jgi:hypothetical protein
MYLDTRKKSASVAVPLQGAVLCVNCECVTSGRFDECPVCGSHSLLGIGQMLGGTPLSDQAASPKDQNVVLFDLTITLELRQMNPRDINAALERITRLIGPRLGQGRACFHVNVEPVAGSRGAEELKAA